MIGKFGTLIDEVIPVISSSKISLEDLKIFLDRSYQLRSEITRVKSTEAVLKIVVRKKCSILNVAALEAIVNRYEITKGINLIAKYRKEIKKLSSNMKRALINNKKLSLASNSSLACERIEFTLDWEPSDRTFDDISLLLKGAFDDLAEEVIVQIIQKNSPILIVCYAPLHLMNALLLEAQANLPVLLKEMNIIQLTVGHYTVYDRRQEKVNNGNFIY